MREFRGKKGEKGGKRGQNYFNQSDRIQLNKEFGVIKR